MSDRNCLSHWFPKLEAAGLPVPRTRIVPCETDLRILLDGNTPLFFEDFTWDLHNAALEVGGYPFFLRTGQGSGKHQWRDTCYVNGQADLSQHVYNLVEWSECVDFMGLPTNVWAVRELLPTKPVAVCPYYKDMPVCKEFRFFVKDGEVICYHPYWPAQALVQGGVWGVPLALSAEWWKERYWTVDAAHEADYESLCHLSISEYMPLHGLARDAGLALGGEWSIDILETERGWYVTDCALAARSFHWEGCEKAELFV